MYNQESLDNNVKRPRNKLVLPLVIALLALVFAVGWIVWREFVQQDNQADVNTPTVINTSDKKTEPETPAPKPAVQLSYDDEKYLVVKEWNVKIPVTKSVEGLKYRINDHNKDAPMFIFTTPEVECDGGGVLVMRGRAGDPLPSETTTNATTFKEHYQDPTFLVAKRLGEFYFVSPIVPGASCSADSFKASGEMRKYDSILRAIHNMVPVE